LEIIKKASRFTDDTRQHGLYELFSLLLFSSLCIAAAVLLFSVYYWVFAALIAADGIATLTRRDSIVSSDRALFFFVVLVMSMLESPFNIFSLTVELLILVAALDFSFFLKKLDSTRVDKSVVFGRLRSYAYTMLPTFFLTYVLFYAYSFNLQFSVSQAVAVLGFSFVGALIVVFIVARYLFFLGRGN
jgi:hypothetical protein